MADSTGRPPLKAAFPAPPPFYKHFNLENVKKAVELQESQHDVRLEPTQYCIPPTPPTDEKYRSFGAQHDLAQPEISLADGGITQLYPASDDHNDPVSFKLDPSPHLLALSRSILLNFLELVGILSVDPTHHAEKIEHIQTLYFNVHHLINQYRPHQARESLILMMEEQIKQHKADIAAMNEAEQGMSGMLDSIQHNARQATKSPVQISFTASIQDIATSDGNSTHRQAQARQWAELETELG